MEFELKYIIPNHRLHPVETFIKARCRVDPGYQDATISSVYYDTEQFHHLYEKINSDYYKSKFRVRWYRDTNTGAFSKHAFAEAKFRIGTQRVKQRLPGDVAPEILDSMSMEDHRLKALPGIYAQLGISLPEHLFPILMVRYRRMRFIDPVSQARISVDRDICSPRLNTQLVPGAKPAFLQSAVVEIKGQWNHLPENLLPLLRLGIRKASFSKYLSCFARCNHVVFDPR